MIFNVQEDTLIFLLRSFTSGVILGIVYDVFTVAIRNLPYKTGKARFFLLQLPLFVFDFVFCIICAVFVLLLTYYSGKGIFRISVICLMFLGFLCFRCSVGKIFRRILATIYKIIIKILGILLFPFKFIISKLFLLFRLTIGRIVGKIILLIKESAVKRHQKSSLAGENVNDKNTGEEDFVYVGRKKESGYRKYGRIRF